MPRYNGAGVVTAMKKAVVKQTAKAGGAKVPARKQHSPAYEAYLKRQAEGDAAPILQMKVQIRCPKKRRLWACLLDFYGTSSDALATVALNAWLKEVGLSFPTLET